ncbi:MAG: M20/M25/M40 family metallo-hydrolase [Planctomycetota bacterium]|nr:M20/M25/M40 family metallo-hydrolase [Planctomycetota bacterium]
MISILKPQLLALVGVVTVCSLLSAEAPDGQTRMKKDLTYLASDKLEGRGVGTQGLNLAADYIRDEFKNAGLNVQAVGGDAFHKFSIVTGSELGKDNSLEFVGPKGESIKLELNKDFQVCSFGSGGTIANGIVFGGYSIEDADNKYNDFTDADVKGKAVIVMRRTPFQSDPKSPFAGQHGGISMHASLRSKVSNAFQKGATAVLFVNDPYSIAKTGQDRFEAARKQLVTAAIEFDGMNPEKPDAVAQSKKKLNAAVKRYKTADAAQKGVDDLMTFGYGGRGSDDSLPIFHITMAACDKLLKAAGQKSLKDLEAMIDHTSKPQTTELKGWTAKANAAVTRIKAEIKNIIGVLEGKGPLADETIVIGAHYDHVGMGGPGSGSLARGAKEVHNGADDNGSGSTALLELARRLAARKEPLPRRLVFIAFTAEEMGLIGSARYVKEPVFPLDKTIAMFNMDMVGRLKDDKLTVFGTGTAKRWDDLIKKTNDKVKLKLAFKPEGFGPSDHSSFYGKQIPVLHLFTNTHSDYHRPTDDVDKINFDGMSRIVDLLETIVIDTANQKERPKYVAIKQTAQIARSGSRPYFGSIPDFGGEGAGYGISGVAPGSPADKGGLKGGDRIIQFGKNKIGSLDDFDLALRKFKPGEVVDVVVNRAGKNVSLKVTLTKPR